MGVATHVTSPGRSHVVRSHRRITVIHAVNYATTTTVNITVPTVARLRLGFTVTSWGQIEGYLCHRLGSSRQARDAVRGLHAVTNSSSPSRHVLVNNNTSPWPSRLHSSVECPGRYRWSRHRLGLAVATTGWSFVHHW